MEIKPYCLKSFVRDPCQNCFLLFPSAIPSSSQRRECFVLARQPIALGRASLMFECFARLKRLFFFPALRHRRFEEKPGDPEALTRKNKKFVLSAIEQKNRRAQLSWSNYLLSSIILDSKASGKYRQWTFARTVYWLSGIFTSSED